MIKILAIDDNENNLIVLKAILSNTFPDICLFTAVSGKEGIHIARTESPDVILLDLVLPIMNSIETCKLLKEDLILKRIPVVMITAYKTDSTLCTKALEAGIDAFLSKPIDEAELLAQVTSIIRLKQSEKQALLENELLEERVKLRTQELVQELEKRKFLEIELRESEERYRALFDRSLDCVYILDFEGSFIDANEAALNLFCYKREEIRGLNISTFLNEDQLPLMHKTLQEIRETGFQKGLTEFRLRLRNGKDVYIETQGSAILSKGTYTAIQSVARNITERKYSENELRKLFRTVEQSPASIVITDLDGHIVYGNPKVCELTGYSIDELLGKNSNIFQSGETPKETYQKLWDTIIIGEEWKGEFHNKKKNGELYWESVLISSILDTEGNMTNFFAIKEDITERKNMIASLEEAKDKAEAGNRLKSAFINNISHEVRTPLNGILGFSNLIVQPNISEADKAKFQMYIETCSNRLLSTITNFIDISLITSGNMEVKPKNFNPDKLCHSLFEHYQPLCESLHLELKLEIPTGTKFVTLFSDIELLTKALSHLIDNAIKFTQKGKITIGYILKSGLLEFFVKDTGTGINKDAQHRIFENFEQVEASISRGTEGSGLGLSIARGLIRLFGSEIYVKSLIGSETIFYFSLPYEMKTTDVKAIANTTRYITNI